MMKPKVFLLIGLPGSGKTHYGTVLSKEFSMEFLDDLKDRKLFESRLAEGKSFVVADPLLCRSAARRLAIEMVGGAGFDPVLVYWENNPEKCLRNVAYRNDGRKVEQTIKDLSKHYLPPDDALEIWQPSADDGQEDD